MKNYELTRDNNRLVFKTSSYKAEKSSVLHSGVYSKEFTSMLFASGVCIFSYLVSDMIGIRSPIIDSIILITLFVGAFLGANTFIFKKSSLEAVFDRGSETISIIKSGLISARRETIPFARIESVDVGSRRFVPENADGIDFVQKISAQHGSAMPGLSEVEEFVTLSLRLKDGSKNIIYAAQLYGGTVNGEPEIPVQEIRSFLNIKARHEEKKAQRSKGTEAQS